ncbi:hypothetical protein Nmel_016703, partial [Mimus melanotis]
VSGHANHISLYTAVRTGCGTALSAICWRPAASQPCRGPNPERECQLQCSQAMSRKNKRIKKGIGINTL